jgi:hypothetical protein
MFGVDMGSIALTNAKGREWAPRIWEGCNFAAWVRLLASNRFAVSPPYWYIAAVISFVSAGHSVLRLFDRAFFRHRVARTRIQHPPLFILGHWRSGTTLLHELLILDPRHAFPNTYQCLEPNHFILTEKILTRLFAWMLPGRRPMDNMAAGWDRPQEDEFAICMLGAHSPYRTIAFPNRPPIDQDYLDLEHLSSEKRRRWKRTLYSFLQQLTYKDPRRLILKSPTHTARISTLLEMFPEAQFVHITRNPYVVFPSTVNLWKSLYRKHGLQTPTFAGLEEYVFKTFERMYEKFDVDSKLVRTGRFHELKYEDLVHDPIGEMRRLYDRLELGNFETVIPRLQEYLDRTKGYETNKYELTPELKAEIGRRWGHLIKRFGYAVE